MNVQASGARHSRLRRSNSNYIAVREHPLLVNIPELYSPVHQDPEMAREVVLVALQCILKLRNSRRIITPSLSTRDYAAC
jgi:hypothetical protein